MRLGQVSSKVRGGSRCCSVITSEALWNFPQIHDNVGRDREDHIELSGIIRVQCAKIFCVATGSCLYSAVAVNKVFGWNGEEWAVTV